MNQEEFFSIKNKSVLKKIPKRFFISNKELRFK